MYTAAQVTMANQVFLHYITFVPSLSKSDENDKRLCINVKFIVCDGV